MKGTTEKVINQKGGFLGQLMRIGLTSNKNILTPLAKSVLISLGLMTAASDTDAAIQKKIYGSDMITLIISIKETKDIVEIVKNLE